MPIQPTTITCAALKDPVVHGGALVEEISAPTRASIVVGTGAAIDADAAIGAPAVISLPADQSLLRELPLVVTGVIAADLDTGEWRYTLELEHPVGLLRLRRDHRTFIDMSVKQIIAKVLEPLTIAHEWTASRGTTPRLACVQSGETDYAFFSRLLAEEGIFWFCPDDPSAPKLVIADAISAFSAITGGDAVRLADEGAGQGIHEIALEHSVTSGAVALADFNYEKPGVDLTVRVKLDASPAGEVFEYPGGYVTQDEGLAIAKIRAEELASDKVLAYGASTRAHLRAAAWFELKSEIADAPTGKYLLRRVEHTLESARYENRFVASPFGIPFRPKRMAPRPVVHGALCATVTGPAGQEIHTDKLGRMKALYAFDRLGKKDDSSSQWMRVVQPALGGSMMLARVGWEMAIRHLDGDSARAVAVARLYDGEHLPPETLPAKKTKTSFETLTSPKAEKINAITLDDQRDAMIFDVKAAKDLDATILHDELETIGANDTLAVGRDSTTLIGDKQTIAIDKNETNKIAKDAGVAIAQNRNKTVTKDETATIQGGLSVRVDGNDTQTVSQNLDFASDKALLERTKGAHELTVGGAYSAKTKKDYTVYIAGKSTETVGGAKSVTSSAGPLSDSAGGNVTMTIGGALVETADGNFVSAAQGDMSRTVGAIGAVTAAGKLQVKAKTIKITVTGAATFLGAGGVVSLSPASVGFVGMVTLKGSGGVEISGAPQMVG